MQPPFGSSFVGDASLRQHSFVHFAKLTTSNLHKPLFVHVLERKVIWTEFCSFFFVVVKNRYIRIFKMWIFGKILAFEILENFTSNFCTSLQISYTSNEFRHLQIMQCWRFSGICKFCGIWNHRQFRRFANSKSSILSKIEKKRLAIELICFRWAIFKI